MLGKRPVDAPPRDGFFASVVGSFLGLMAIALFASVVP
jgi:hypothetical protein